MREKDIEKTVVARARRRGLLVYKWAGVNQRGVPDDIFITRRGFVFFVEFKATGKRHKLTPLQTRRVHELRQQGCTVFVVADVAEGHFIVDLMEDGQ